MANKKFDGNTTPLRGSVNKALLLQTATASGAGAVHLNAQGHLAV